MPQVNFKSILQEHRVEVRRALANGLSRVQGGGQVDTDQLASEFLRELSRHLAWVDVRQAEVRNERDDG